MLHESIFSCPPPSGEYFEGLTLTFHFDCYLAQGSGETGVAKKTTEVGPIFTSAFENNVDSCFPLTSEVKLSSGIDSVKMRK